jgi:hypothetical protein
MMARDVVIDRLALDLPGVSEAGARRIALMVAAGLGAAGGLPQAFAAPHISLQVSAPSGAGERTLARLILEAALRDLARAG